MAGVRYLAEIGAVDRYPDAAELGRSLDGNLLNHISTAEAKARGLPGHDTFRFSHLMYHDPVNRDYAVWYLCREALKAFNDTLMISQRGARLAEDLATEAWLARGGLTSGTYVDAPATYRWLEFINLEYLKISTGFELIAKSILIEKDYIVHEIDGKSEKYKPVARKQKTSPVSVSEVIEIDSYRFNGRINYLPGVTEASLRFGLILSEATYQSVINIPDADLKLINEFRTLRNQIHLPGDAIECPIMNAHSKSPIEFIVEFLNKWVIERGNLINDVRGFRGDRWLSLSI